MMLITRRGGRSNWSDSTAEPENRYLHTSLQLVERFLVCMPICTLHMYVHACMYICTDACTYVHMYCMYVGMQYMCYI